MRSIRYAVAGGRHASRRSSNQAGVALVELALVLPLLLLLTFTVTEFGRAIYQYNLVVKSVRDAVRYLSVQTPNTHMTEAKNLVVYGTTASGSVPLALGLTTGMVSPTWPAAVGTNPPVLTVTVTVSGYQFKALAPSVFGTSIGTAGVISFGDISATMRAPS